MKINNFSELDKVLKNSFSNIKDDMIQLKKEIDVELKEVEKQNKNSLDIVDTKIRFVAEEIKRFKNYKNELLNEQKDALNEFKGEHQSAKEELKEDYKKELEKIKADTIKLKDNFVKVMDILKEKLVTKSAFEQNNRAVEKAILDLIEKTKDIEQIKFNYFSKLNVNRQLNSVQDDFNAFKQEFSAAKSAIDEFLALRQEFAEFKDSSRFVQEDVFSNKMKDMDALKESIESLNANLNRMSEKSSSSVDINLFNNEIEDIRKRLGMISEIEEKFETAVKKEDIVRQDSEFSALKEKQDSFMAELAELKAEVKENKELKKEIEKLKAELEKSQHKIEKNTALIGMIKSTKSSVKVKDSEAEEAPEEAIAGSTVDVVEEKLKEPKPAESEESTGLFKRTMKGIADFFLEEDDMLEFETPAVDEQYGTELQTESRVKYTPKPVEDSISDTKFVSEIEKMFDETSTAPEINIKLDSAENKENFLEKIKKGVVNFFFEEADEEDFVFQSEEIGKDEEAILNAPEETPKVEIVDTGDAAEEKKASKRGRKSKEAREEAEIEAVKEEIGDAEPEPEDSKEEKPKSEKKYMRSKRPRIFEDIHAEGEASVDNELDDLTKGKKKAKKADAAAGTEDYIYYPEDYFY